MPTHPTSSSSGTHHVTITRGIPMPTPRPVIEGAQVKMAPDNPQMTRDELLAFVKGADVIVSMFHDKIDAKFLAAAGPQLKGVCNFAVGVDNIDLTACGAAKVIATNTPDAVTEGTANLALGLLLDVARRISEGDRFVRTGQFEKHGNGFPLGWMGMHLAGQTMLIVGAGRIGKALAMRAQALGMKILYTARSSHIDFEQAPLAAQRVELEDGLRIADVVSIHTPLTPQTRHLMNAARLAMLKPTAILINTSRGPTVDEAALVAVLQQRRIWGAGLDVFEHEPKVHPGLLTLDNVVLTPHVGSAEQRWREEMTRMVFANATAILAGKSPPNRVG